MFIGNVFKTSSELVCELIDVSQFSIDVHFQTVNINIFEFPSDDLFCFKVLFTKAQPADPRKMSSPHVE